jgi:hypothetical protein
MAEMTMRVGKAAVRVNVGEGEDGPGVAAADGIRVGSTAIGREEGGTAVVWGERREREGEREEVGSDAVGGKVASREWIYG